MDVFRYLHALSERNGSDLFFSVGAPVTLKREGHYHPLEEKPLGPGEVKQLAYQLMSQKQIAEFEHTLEMNLAVGVPNAGRFRINVYYRSEERRVGKGGRGRCAREPHRQATREWT